MIVEIVGLPGSGKTSIIKELQNYNNSQDKINFIGKDQCKHGNNIIEILKFFIRLIFFYPKIILNIKLSRWLLTKISLRLCHYKNNIKEELCVLNDSGVLMPIISFIIQHNKYSFEVDLKKLISALSLPDIIVFIHSDVNTVIDRYANRGGVQTKGVGIRDSVVKNTELYEHFSLGYEALLNLQNILKKKKCTVIVINNNDSVEFKTIPPILFHKLVSELELG